VVRSECASPKRHIAVDITEEFEQAPARFVIKGHPRRKHASVLCETGVAEGAFPPGPGRVSVMH